MKHTTTQTIFPSPFAAPHGAYNQAVHGRGKARGPKMLETLASEVSPSSDARADNATRINNLRRK